MRLVNSYAIFSQHPILYRRGALALIAIALVSPRAASPQVRVLCAAAPRAKPSTLSAGNAYVGGAACAQCHPVEAASQIQTPMAKALAPPADSVVLREHPLMTFRNGSYTYRVARSGGGAQFLVSDGKRDIAVPIEWAFGYGAGGVGQTYVFRYGGYYFESQVSYYARLKGLAITIGHVAYPPASLGAALGYPLQPDSVRRCFACHATDAVSDGELHLETMIPGVSCEACHGPGARHIAAMKSGNLTHLYISNPGRLSTGQITAFCGSCHRTADDERRLKIRGVENVRFQGYRLVLSRCYSALDSRISCISCHDPHQAVVTRASYYDAKCEACHSTRRPSNRAAAPACPVATHDCVTCHMPKSEVPGAHHSFTDHFIHIVRPNEPYAG